MSKIQSRNLLQRCLWGALPAAAAFGGVWAGATLLPGASRPVVAQEKPALTAAQMNVATSLEGAFMRISDTVGPATVSITATEPAQPASDTPTPRAPGMRRRQVAPQVPAPGDDSNDDPFGGLLGQEGSPFRSFRPDAQSMPRRQATASGSGVIVRPDGYILTNDHVVELASNGQVTVTLADGSSYKGTVKRDPRSDLAVVKISSDKPLPYVKIADSSNVHVGQWAIAIGSPFGQQNTMTTGIVSALHRKREIADGDTPRLYPNLIQTDASINPGNSGGPLLNIEGELVGINVAIFSPTGTNLGIGYAIPANTAKNVMDQLITNGRVVRGSLGLIPDDVPAVLRKQLGTASGAYITTVNDGTPAQRAGLEAGDVVTRYGDRAIASESDLRDAIALTKPGTSISVTVLRGGKSLSLSVTPEAQPQDKIARATPEAPATTRQATSALGFASTSVTAELLQQASLPADTKGAFVRGVQPGSLAGQAGLTPGTVVVAVNSTTVASPEALTTAIRTAKSGDTVTLRTVSSGPEREGDKPTVSRSVVNITLP